MFNKIVNINYIITKIRSSCVIMCTHLGKKRTTFAKVTLKIRMDPSSRTQAWLTTVLN